MIFYVARTEFLKPKRNSERNTNQKFSTAEKNPKPEIVTRNIRQSISSRMLLLHFGISRTSSLEFQPNIFSSKEMPAAALTSRYREFK